MRRRYATHDTYAVVTVNRRVRALARDVVLELLDAPVLLLVGRCRQGGLGLAAHGHAQQEHASENAFV